MLFADDYFTEDDHNVRVNMAFSVGDMEEGFIYLIEQDTDQGILEAWSPAERADMALILYTRDC